MKFFWHPRHRYRRYLYFTFFVFLFLVFGTPFIIGWIFKHEFISTIKSINTNYGVKVSILAYDQGWLSSTAKLRIDYSSQLPASALLKKHSFSPLILTMDQRIIHGPIIYNPLEKKLQWGLASVHGRVYLAYYLRLPPLRTQKIVGIVNLTTLMQFNRAFQAIVNIPFISLSIYSLGSMNGFSLNGDMSATFNQDQINHVEINLDLGKFIVQVDANNTQIMMDPMQWHYESGHDQYGLWSGNTYLYGLGGFFKNASGLIINVGKLSITSVFSTSEETLYNGSITANMDKLITNKPFLSAPSPFYVRLSANNYTLKNLNSYIQFFKSNLVEAIDLISPSTIERLLTSTVLSTSSLSGHFRLTTPWGAFRLHSRSLWKPNAPLPSTWFDLINNGQTTVTLKAPVILATRWMSVYHDHLQINAKPGPNTFVPTTDQMIGALKLAGYFSQLNDDYVSTLTITDGQLALNGKVVHLSDW